MPLHQPLLYFLFGAALFGGGSVVIHNYVSPPAQRETAEVQRLVPTAPATTAPERSEPSRKKAPSRPQTEAATVAPSFDIVRIEANGNGVVAGRAEPGWTVIIESGNSEIGTVIADGDGEWAHVLETPLLPGEHSLALRAMSPERSRGLVSEQRVAVSVAKPKAPGKTVVALSEPGKPTRVLTRKKSGEKPAAVVTREFKPEPAEQSEGPGQAAATPPEAAPAETKATLPELPVSAAEPSSGLPEQVVAFDAVDYEIDAKGEGKLFLSGQAKPGTRVKLYLNNDRVGEAVAGENGLWTFESLRTLRPEQEHRMRADAIQADGQVASRAEVEFEPPVRPEAPAPTVTAAAPSAPVPPPEPEKSDTRPAIAPAAKPAPQAVAEQRKTPPATAPVSALEPEKRDTGTPETPPVVALVPKAPETMPLQKESDAAAAPGSLAESGVKEEQKPSPPARETAQVPQPTPAEPAPARQVTASAPAPAPPAAKTGTAVPETTAPAPKSEETIQTAAAPAPVQPAPSATTAEAAGKKRPILKQVRSIVVRRGDTLWHIAERRYGRGWRYTVIYKSNRRQIRNPHWIYPGQEFRLPDG